MWSSVREATVVVDLGAPRAIESVEAHVQGGGYAGVEFPESATIALSEDGYYVKAGSGWKMCTGFDKAAPTVVLDLGAVCRMGAARVHLQGGGQGDVWFPEQVSVATSTDGKTWAPAGETREHPPEEMNTAAAFMGVACDDREARFVRFRFKKRGWVMLDEIEVFPSALRAESGR